VNDNQQSLYIPLPYMFATVIIGHPLASALPKL